ncbi:hypothetical protein B9N43_10685 [Denitratisoma sp. DHT3]|uniref:DHA2 family efflux MFS transporter permease subunit n=1 Tax=Denitratisoma sp. DHT3 TaxID=1981880 RepID=UPI001198C4B4|nr:DHA2 family efflux MFS transporter permease subunit [Denitratisoma sp. DHT3]QDX81679.1 hypothetical protein B9N43_10685 [Denitratisoma sp. DHT3]
MNAAHAPLPPIEGGKRLLATLAVSLACFMYTLEMAVANLSLPAIAGDLGVSPPQATWVITAYAVTSAIITPLSGWLTARVGQVRLFVYSLLLFALTSLFCALATSLPLLILARCLQGAVVAPLMPVAIALLLQAYPPSQAALAVSISMFTMMFSPVVGPIIGGWITENLSWPWIFYINVPIGVLVAIASWRLFKDRESPRVRQPVDMVGLILLAIWVGALQILLDKGRELGWFESGEILALGVTALMGFCFFLVWEWYEAHPIVELRLFANRNFVVGTATNSLWSFIYLGNILLLPLWLQQSLGYTATWAGLVVAPSGLAAVIMQPVANRLLGVSGIRSLATVGLAMLALAAYLRAGFTSGVAPEHIVPAQICNGIGSTCFSLASSLLLFNGLSQWQIASASGLSSFVRLMATAMGTSFAATIWDSRTYHHRSELAAHVTPYDNAIGQFMNSASALGMDLTGALIAVEHQLTAQAQTLAANDYFWLSSLLFLGIAALIWLARPVAAPPGTPPAVLEH